MGKAFRNIRARGRAHYKGGTGVHVLCLSLSSLLVEMKAVLLAGEQSPAKEALALEFKEFEDVVSRFLQRGGGYNV